MSIPASDDVIDPDEACWSVRSVDLCWVSRQQVTQHLRDGHLVGIRRNGAVVVPKVFFDENGRVLKQLPGLLIVLKDGGFNPTETVRWLFTPDESLTLSRDGSTEKVSTARPVDACEAPGARGHPAGPGLAYCGSAVVAY